MNPKPPIRLDRLRRILVVSIHDVMPETLDQCQEIFELLLKSRLDRVTLLVVPGKNWTPSQVDTLRSMQRQGAILAGHGWQHHCDSISGFRHRMHSSLISRDVAEHLALDADEISALIHRCHAWFGEHGLDVSELYVPPAWAMGAISRRQLAETPFSLFETLSGVLDTNSGQFRRSAMVGFEADNLLRAISCSIWNRLNLFAAGNHNPVRVAIHPNDLSLRLRDSLRNFIERGGHSMTYNLLAA